MAVYNDKNHPNKSKEGDCVYNQNGFQIRSTSSSSISHLLFSKKNIFLSKFKRFSEIASIDGA